jgi:putative peptidoglycan lipid II flippase
VHVGIATMLGYVAAILIPPAIGVDPIWGTAGLAASASIAGWVELWLLRRTLNVRIGSTGVPPALTLKLWTAALGASAAGWAVKLAAPSMHPIARAAIILAPFGAVYVGLTVAFGVAEARRLLARRAIRL